MMLSGKVVIVTGAGRGIGRAIAQLCGREGGSVIVNDSGVELDGRGGDPGPAMQTAADINAAGGKAFANTASTTVRVGALSIVEDALSQFGRVDAVINAAGVLRNSDWHDMSRADWDAVIDVHLNAAFNICRAATPHFRDQGSGSFVHFTSGAALNGVGAQANFAAASMGVVGLSRSIGQDMAQFGTRSNCVAPMAWSRMTETMTKDSPAGDPWVDVLKTMAPENVAPLAVYLASDAAADVNGQFFGAYGDKIELYSTPVPIRSITNDLGWTPQTVAEQLIPAFRKQMR